MSKYLVTLTAQRAHLLAKYQFVFARPSVEDLHQWESLVHVPSNVLAELGKLDARISMAHRGRAMHWVSYALTYHFRPRGMSVRSLNKWMAS